jgi:hypothetical protein
MNIVIPDCLLKLALVLASAAFGLCIVVGVFPFVGLVSLIAPAAIVLFTGVFPLFFGAVLVLVRRAKGTMAMDWMPILFLGLPPWFSKAYRSYFFLIWIGGLAAFVQAFRGQPSWLALLFVLVPSVFYAACIGAYWSELRVRQKGGS